jgi:hypothetical protein
MTPKEKAKELVDKMYVIHTHSASDYYFAIHCALIAVDEILSSNNTIFETNIPHECWKYWEEVKQEIELL